MADPFFSPYDVIDDRDAEIARLKKALVEAEQRRNKCRHFRGADKPCGVGIELREHVGGDSVGWMLRIPCLTTERSYIQKPCKQHVALTREEIDAENARTEEAIADFISGRSSCCKASLISRGNWRFCSKCHRGCGHVSPARGGK